MTQVKAGTDMARKALLSAHLPADLAPSALVPGLHADADAVAAEVNAFFLQHWPFRSDKHRRRFVDEGYALFMCLLCPASLADRMHWGCRLLTAGFLIDDLLDRMSAGEGAAHNARIAECVRGTRQPDRTQPAEWIMADLFRDMRAVDRRLADELLEPMVDFLAAQADAGRARPMGLGEYFEYRDADLGKGLTSGIMRFCAGLHMTARELEAVRAAEANCMRHITFVNDACSYEKEVQAAREGFELGAVCSAVPIVMELAGLDEAGAKRVMWQMVRAWEVRHGELVRAALAECPTPALATYLRLLEYQMSGNELWSLWTPRYNRAGTVLAFDEGR